MFTANGSVGDRGIAAFENDIRLLLPQDYKNFLKSTNGGQFKDTIIRPQQPGELLIDCLFGLGMRREFDLRFWVEEFRGEVPEKSIVIGSDAGGGFFILWLEKGMEGVYYYDHSHSFPSSDLAENTYFMYPAFMDLIVDVGIQGSVVGL